MTEAQISVFSKDSVLKNAKPCPFCGGKKTIIAEQNIGGTVKEWVECFFCEAMGPVAKKTRTHSLAIKRWNARTADFSLEKMIERQKNESG